MITTVVNRLPDSLPHSQQALWPQLFYSVGSGLCSKRIQLKCLCRTIGSDHTRQAHAMAQRVLFKMKWVCQRHNSRKVQEAIRRSPSIPPQKIFNQSPIVSRRGRWPDRFRVESEAGVAQSAAWANTRPIPCGACGRRSGRRASQRRCLRGHRRGNAAGREPG